jgi:hypothetical protein
MEIIKHGNPPKVKFVCALCGCEYVEKIKGVYVVRNRGGETEYLLSCPDCGCENRGVSIDAQ